MRVPFQETYRILPLLFFWQEDLGEVEEDQLFVHAHLQQCAIKGHRQGRLKNWTSKLPQLLPAEYSFWWEHRYLPASIQACGHHQMVQRLNFFIAFLCPVLLTLLMKACSWYHHAVIIIIMMLGMIVFFLFFFFNIFYVFLVWLSVKLTVDVFSEHSIFENYFLYFSRVFSLAVGPGKDQFAWVCMLTQRKFESCSAAPPAPCSMHRVVVTLLRMRPRPTTRHVHEPFCRSRSTCRFL